ncbi:MAG: inorganic diphosphatase [Proteobacteria bacterium]|nr:inorganic diphosphatase [Pseudomonadota bacterium]
MGLGRISAGKQAPQEIHVIIEIPAHSDPIKYEVDKKTGTLFVDRFLSTSMHYPCDYGYIPETLSDDGDPVDVLVITPFPVNHGCVINCRPIGMLAMTDEAGKDRKIIAVPTDKLTSLYQHVQNLNDLPPSLLQQIAHFFTHYKDLEEGKWVKLDGWLDADAAKEEISQSLQRFSDTLTPF